MAGFRSHSRDVLTAADRSRIGVIPVTAPAWTLLDLAAVGTERMRLRGALDDVRVAGAGPAVCAATAGRGTARFDAAYPELRLGFEADGDAWHKGLLGQMRDEARDEQCGLVGWMVRRYGTEDIGERPAGIADEVLRLRRIADAA